MTLLLALLLSGLDAGTLLARPVEVKADRLEVFAKEGRAEYLGHAVATRDSTTLTCDRLVVFYAQDQSVTRIEAHGNVVAVDQDREAKGQDATYDNATGVLVMTGDPEGRQGGRRVRGSEVTFRTGLDRLEVKDARTFVDDAGPHAKGQPLAIDAEALVLDQDRKRATWTGRVKAVQGTATLRAPSLVAFYDAAGAVTKVEARGGAEVTDKDKWAKGQRATFDNQRGVLVVTGNAQARQGTHRMKGTRVTFKSGSDQLEVENATTVIEAQEPPGRKTK